MKLDEKGRLFGKINIIDLIVLIAVLAVVAFFAAYKLMPHTTEKAQKIEMKIMSEEVSDFVVDKIKIGDPVSDDLTNVPLGKVTNIEIGPSISWASNDDGEYVHSDREYWSSVIITTELEGKMYEHGALINNVKYGVGHSATFRFGIGKIYARVYDIKEIEE